MQTGQSISVLTTGPRTSLYKGRPCLCLHVVVVMSSVILFDLETTGLPSREGLRFGEYHAHTDPSKYSEARIVQICYMVCDDELNTVSTHDAIIDSCGEFRIPNARIHGITDERSAAEGEDFGEVFGRFAEALRGASTIVAHNADFDVNVLKAELFRRGMLDLLAELGSKRVVCTMKACKGVVKALNVYMRPKFPTLRELYEFATDKPMLNAHDARHDVLNLHEAIKSLHDRHLVAALAREIRLTPGDV